MKRIAWLGVIVGGIADVVLSTVFSLAIFVVVLLQGAHPSSVRASVIYFAALAVGLLCSALGGFIAAAIAKHDELLNGALSAWLCLGIDFITLLTGPKATVGPLWLTILLIPASPLFGLAGGFLMQRLRRRRPLVTA